MILARVPSLLHGLAAMLPAQQGARPLAADVRAELRHADPARVAWGAFRMAEHRMAECAPELLLALGRNMVPPAGPERERWACALLDAAVQCGVVVPPAFLAPFLAGPEVPLAGLALADRDPRPHVDRLAALLGAKVPDPTWSAALHVLYAIQPQRALALALAQFGLRVRVEVFDMGQGRCDGLSVLAVEQSEFDAGGTWPPRAVYHLTRRAVADSMSLGRPPLVAHATRVRPEPGPTDLGGLPVVPAKLPIEVHGRTAVVLPLLTTLAGLREVPDVLPPDAITHRWTGQEAWQREVVAPIAAARAAWHDLVDRLANRGHLDEPQRRALTARLVVDLEDLRRDRTAALPPLAPLPGTGPDQPRR